MQKQYNYSVLFRFFESKYLSFRFKETEEITKQNSKDFLIKWGKELCQKKWTNLPEEYSKVKFENIEVCDVSKIISVDKYKDITELFDFPLTY